MMSLEYQLAMRKANRDLDVFAPKLYSAEISPAEATILLNSQWQVYLYAVSEGDIQEAKETITFIDLIVVCLKLTGYSVVFTDLYCVSRKETK